LLLADYKVDAYFLQNKWIGFNSIQIPFIHTQKCGGSSLM
jgi:hypothetical protein